MELAKTLQKPRTPTNPKTTTREIAWNNENWFLCEPNEIELYNNWTLYLWAEVVSDLSGKNTINTYTCLRLGVKGWRGEGGQGERGHGSWSESRVAGFG